MGQYRMLTGCVAHDGGCSTRGERVELADGHDYPPCLQCTRYRGIRARHRARAAAMAYKQRKLATSLVFIYALREPTTLEVRYVGKTSDIDSRRWQHINNTHSRALCTWLRELARDSREPLLLPLWVVDPGDDTRAAERRWYDYFDRLPGSRLLNWTRP